MAEEIKQEIIVQRSWLLRLKELADLVEDSEGNDQHQWTHHLLGYISSVETILKYQPKNDQRKTHKR